jgi:signal peptidase II
MVALLGVIALVVVGLDQASKVWAVENLTGRAPAPVVDGWLQLHLIRNSGAAFSLATGATWIFTVVATVVTVVILRTARRLQSRWWAVALGLLLGGALGNLVDRLVRAPGFARGHVVDFIEFQRFPFMDFPIFNLADSSVVTGAILIALLGVWGVTLDGQRPDG